MDINLLYEDIIFLIFDNLIVDFEKILLEQIKHNHAKIKSESKWKWNLKYTISQTLDEIIYTTCKNSNFAGFIFSCKTIYSFFKKYQERPQFKSELYIKESLDSDKNDQYDQYNELNLIAIIQLKSIFSGAVCKNYYDFIEFNIIEGDNEEIGFTYKKCYGKMERKYINRQIIRKKEEEYYIFYLASGSFHILLYIDQYANHPRKIYFRDENHYDIFKMKVENDSEKNTLIPKYNIKILNENIGIDDIKNFLECSKVYHPLEKKVIFKFLSEKDEFESYEKILKFIKDITIRFNNFYKKYEITAAAFNNEINKKS